MQLTLDQPFFCLLDGKGGGIVIEQEKVADWNPSQGVLWVHLNYTRETDISWLREASHLDPLIIDALLADETRPRTTAIGEGLLVALRGVNLNPGADPEDMVSIRFWIDSTRIVSTRRRRLLSAADIVDQLNAGRGPCNPGEFLIELVDKLTRRMSDTVDQFEDKVNELEEQVLSGEKGSLRFDLADLRRKTIAIRRYLAPQREALTRLVSEKISWLEEGDRMHLREAGDRLVRHIEDIDAVRDRAAVTQEELLSRVSEQMNARMYVLSIVAAIFLPLGFFTGLLGINVGGIPGSENPWAFLIFIGLLVVIVVLQIMLFRWKKWM